MDEFDFDAFESFAKIVVIGVGGAGSNAVNRMIEEKIRNIDFWVANTDAQALATSKTNHKLVLGTNTSKGLGAGGNPEIGEKASLESEEDIRSIVEGANIVFVAAGMGGGTGTGAAPVISRIAREAGALTIAIVTRPFNFEGKKRKNNALDGLNKLKENVDSFIVVSNDKLLFQNGNRSLGDAFKEADKVLALSVKTITDLITVPGLINLDFNDVKTILSNKGLALIGFGQASGDKKAQEAATQAISSPLIEASIQGAKSAIVNITTGPDVTMFDVQDAIQFITEATGSNLNIIFGVTQNAELGDEMMVSVIATEFDDDYTPTEVNEVPERRPIKVEKEIEEVDDEDSILPDFIANKE